MMLAKLTTWELVCIFACMLTHGNHGVVVNRLPFSLADVAAALRRRFHR